MIIRIIGISLFMLLFNLVKADWPVGKGRTTIITSYIFLKATSNYNNSWKKVKFDENNSFLTQIATFSIMHGIDRTTDLVLNVPYINQKYVNQTGTLYGSGVGDISMGISKHFSSINNHRHFTLKGLFTIPMYSLDTNNTLGLGYGSRAFSIEANYSLSVGKAGYFSGQVNYANYFDNQDRPQQLTYTINYGRRINFFNSMSFSFSHQESNSPNKGFDPNIFTNTSYKSGRLSASYGRRITRTMLVLLQASTIIYGQNTVNGVSFGTSLIFRLP